jgi:hypothetical protein
MTATISDYALRRTVSPEVAKAIQERKGLPVLDLAAYLDAARAGPGTLGLQRGQALRGMARPGMVPAA